MAMESMAMDDFETTVKVIAVGNGQVGKTSMTTLYCKGKFTDTYKKTIGVDFMEKSIEIEELGETVRLMVWDTAGQEEFDSLTSRYYKGAGAALLVFACNDRASFDALPEWRRKVAEEAGNIPMAIVQNKMDLHPQALMSDDEVEAMCTKLGLRLYRTCVMQNTNVKEAFEFVTTQYILRGGGDPDGAIAHITDFPADEAPEPAAAPAAAEPAAAAPTAKDIPDEPKVQMTAPPTRPSKSRAAAARPQDSGFKLSNGPSRVRTGGKKRGIKCTIL